MKRFIFTGTPGSGKTSAIKELGKLGYSTIQESATDVIALEQDRGIESPWEKRGFINKIIQLQRERQMNATGDLQFYDRSPVCTYALYQYVSRWRNAPSTPPPLLLQEIQRCLKEAVYKKEVFFFENLGFIEQTNARKLSYQEALIFEEIHLEAYKQFAFNIIVVPKGLTPQQRCQFILKMVA